MVARTNDRAQVIRSAPSFEALRSCATVRSSCLETRWAIGVSQVCRCCAGNRPGCGSGVFGGRRDDLSLRASQIACDGYELQSQEDLSGIRDGRAVEGLKARRIRRGP